MGINDADLLASVQAALAKGALTQTGGEAGDRGSDGDGEREHGEETLEDDRAKVIAKLQMCERILNS